MGRDKAFIDVHGRPLAAVARDALLQAGATEVLAVGGDAAKLEGLGLQPVPDDHPGDGPLGGIITGLRAAANPVVVVLACDLLFVDAATVRRLARALGDPSGTADQPTDVAVPVVGQVPQILAAAWRRGSLDALQRAFDLGIRSPREALSDLRVREVRGVAPRLLLDADSPEDLTRYAPR